MVKFTLTFRHKIENPYVSVRTCHKIFSEEVGFVKSGKSHVRLNGRHKYVILYVWKYDGIIFHRYILQDQGAAAEGCLTDGAGQWSPGTG